MKLWTSAMKRLLPSALTIGISACSFLSQSLAANLQCASVFQSPRSSEVFSTQAFRAARFFALLDRGLALRYANDAEVTNLVEHLVALPSSAVDVHLIQWDSIQAEFKKKRQGHELTLIIPRVIVKTHERTLNLGERPKGLNLQFSKMMVGIIESLKVEAAHDPTLTSIEIRAGQVVNLGLIELLKEAGFTRLPSSGSGATPSLRTSLLPMGPGLPPIGGPGSYLGGIRGDSPLFGGPQRDSEVGRTWTLRLEVISPD